MAFKMKAGKEGPMRKNFGKDITPMNFTASLRAASKDGKLDNNPKFKAAVDKAPVKMKKDNKPTGPNTQPTKQLSPEQIKRQGEKLKKIMEKGKVKKIITDVNQGVGKAVKRKESPKKILGLVGGLAAKALGNKKIRKGIGKIGGTALQAFGGPLGAMAGKAMGGMLMKKAPNKMKKK